MMFLPERSINVLKVATLLLVAVLPIGCEASFGPSISSYINVQIPSSLHVHNTSGGMTHNRAHFGAHWDLWKQEGRMVALIAHAQGPLCDLNNITTKTFPQPPFFLMADHGACTSVSKARRAQELGAAGLVLVNMHCLCSENCTDNEHCDEHLPFLDDDGSGSSITIPTMIISQSHGEHMKAAIRKEEPVLLEMAWKFPKHEHNVTVDFWHTPNHMPSQEFLTNFSSLAVLLDDAIDFRPHQFILDGINMGCKNHADTNGSACEDMCTNNGRYCAPTYKGVHGKKVVVESLRRMCLWNHHKNQKEYWVYLDQFNDQCRSDYFDDDKCLKDVFKYSHIDEDQIQSCMDESGGTDKDFANVLLEEAVKQSAHVIETPTVWINHLPMRWPLGAKSVFESVCLGFATGKAPHVCYACGYCGDPGACASRHPMHCNAHDGEMPEPSKKSKSKKNGGGGGGFWKFMLVVILLACVGGYIYYKKYVEDGHGMGMGGYSLGEALMSDTA